LSRRVSAIVTPEGETTGRAFHPRDEASVRFLTMNKFVGDVSEFLGRFCVASTHVFWADFARSDALTIKSRRVD